MLCCLLLVFSVVRVAQSLVFCVVFSVLYPGFYSVVRVAQSVVFSVVFFVVYRWFHSVVHVAQSDWATRTTLKTNDK
jgi:hypothetical protein